MKVFFLNITSRRELKFRPLKLINTTCTYEELLIPLEMLNKRVFEYSHGLFGKIKSYFFDRKLNVILVSKDKEKIYVLPKVLDKVENNSALSSIRIYIENILTKLGYRIHEYSGNIKCNLDKYIQEELEKLKLTKLGARILLIYRESENIDFDLLEEMIKQYKTVDICCTNLNEEKISPRIDKINEEYGSSITVKSRITKQEIKTKPYNICIYMQKSDFKLSNTARVQLWDNDSDKYDKNVILANKNKLIKNINSDYFAYMTKNYGRLKVISLLCNTSLDKNTKIM